MIVEHCLTLSYINKGLLDVLSTLRAERKNMKKEYVSTKIDGIKDPHNGRFGKGYIIKRNNPKSSRYCYIDYYIEKEF